MNLRLINVRISILFFCCLLLMVSTADACPTCKLALEGTDHGQQGYAYSIMFMMTMPFLIALGWTLFIWRSLKQAKKLALVQA